MTLITLDFAKGMTNRYGDSDIPKGYVRDAKDILIGNTGQLRFPRWGKTQVYAGNCHSIFESSTGTFFVEDGDLKKLNNDYTATTIRVSVGDSRMYYAELVFTLFFCNEDITGIYTSDTGAVEWGCARVSSQPDSTVLTTGDMYAGDYRYAITWIGSLDEGGTGNSEIVTVPEGGSIVLSNFPTAPDYVTAFAVWVTSVNGKDLLLYGEYPIDTTTVTITRLTADGVEPTQFLETQFAYPPLPKGTITIHQGRMYYALGNFVYWTLPFHYGQQVTGSYWNFDSEVQYIASMPGVMYVATLAKHYKITNIDEDSPVQIEELVDVGGVKGSVCIDKNGIYFYSMTGRGIVRGSPEKLEELTYEALAMPSYSSGTMTMLELDGLRQLLFVGEDAIRNPQEHSDYTQLTPTVPIAWIINMDTGAITRATFTANRLTPTYCSDATGICIIGGNTDNSTTIYGSLRTGLSDFKEEAGQDRTYDPNAIKHLSDAYIVMKGGKMVLTTTCDDGALIYSTIATTRMEQIKIDRLARGTRSYLWQIGIDNLSSGTTVVNAVKIELQSLTRRSGRAR